MQKGQLATNNAHIKTV